MIVPVRDRRQRRRILTLKNLRNAFLVALGLFAGLTIVANVRGRHAPKDDFGRLYGRRIERTEVAPRPQDIVVEAPIADADHADPTLIRAQIRAQLLQAESNVPPVEEVPLMTASSIPPMPATTTGEAHLTLVGGPEGVQLVKKPAAAPVLGGGFGRPSN